MNKNLNAAEKYSAMKKIYHENYLEDISRRMREKAANEKEDSS